jgi:dihydroflavonol-4-reductase
MSSRVVFLTGATGFVGGALLPRLVESGREVHAFARRDSPRSFAAGLNVIWHTGDLAEPASLAPALRAAGERARRLEKPLEVVHNGALISYRTRDAALAQVVNVDGTRALLDAAASEGATRVLYVSSVVAVGAGRDPGDLRDEESSFEDGAVASHYVRTKRAAEELVLARAATLDVVAVNPGAVFGVSPRASNSQRFVERIAAGRTPRLAPPGSLSVVGLEDVAEGILRALERGARGRRYLLCEENLLVRDLLRRVAACAGVRTSVLTVPRAGWRWLVAASRLLDRLAPLDGLTPQGLELLGLHYRFDARRAREELGWRPQPFGTVLEGMLRDLPGSGAPIEPAVRV